MHSIASDTVRVTWECCNCSLVSEQAVASYAAAFLRQKFWSANWACTLELYKHREILQHVSRRFVAECGAGGSAQEFLVTCIFTSLGGY